jgi:hypothetical protein
MTYDGSDPDSDGVVEADVDNDSLSTGDAVTDTLALAGDTMPASPRQPEVPTHFSVKPHPNVDNPIIANAADPMWQEKDGTVAIFYEKWNTSPKNIAVVTIDGNSVGSETTVLNESWVQAYPFPYRENGTDYLIPANSTGSGHEDEVRVYEANTWPTDYSYNTELLNAADVGYSAAIDFTFWQWTDGRYYAFFENENGNHTLIHSDEGDTIFGRSWSEHPNSPFTTSDLRMRGRPVQYPDGRLYLMSKPDVTMLEVTDLSTSSFSYSTVGRLVEGHNSGGWHNDNQHHVDVALPSIQSPQGFAVVDGYDGSKWSTGLYTLADSEDDFVTMYNSKTQTASDDGSKYTVTFDTVAAELGDIIADTSNNQMTVKTSGYYDINARLVWSDTIDSTPFESFARLRNFDKSNNLDNDIHQLQQNDEQSQLISANNVWLESGESIRVELFCDAGSGSGQPLKGGRAKCRFEIKRVR